MHNIIKKIFFLNRKISYDSKNFFIFSILIVSTEFTFKNSYILSNKSKFNKNILYFDHNKSNFHFGLMKYAFVPSLEGHLR
jgi:hypothetical protein